jgi:putative endonuclease
MKAFVYILKDEAGKFYIGSTSDLQRRLKQHERKHTQTTRNMSRPKLVLKQECSTLLIARRIENKIKKMKRKDYIEKMVSDGYIKIAE